MNHFQSQHLQGLLCYVWKKSGKWCGKSRVRGAGVVGRISKRMSLIQKQCNFGRSPGAEDVDQAVPLSHLFFLEMGLDGKSGTVCDVNGDSA